MVLLIDIIQVLKVMVILTVGHITILMAQQACQLVVRI